MDDLFFGGVELDMLHGSESDAFLLGLVLTDSDESDDASSESDDASSEFTGGADVHALEYNYADGNFDQFPPVDTVIGSGYVFDNDMGEVTPYALDTADDTLNEYGRIRGGNGEVESEVILPSEGTLKQAHDEFGVSTLLGGATEDGQETDYDFADISQFGDALSAYATESAM